ncbi:MAG: tetratricopeptide repeat protein [Pirellulaceae bacterium]
MIAFTCKCGKHFQVKAELAGKRAKCPACGEVLVIPHPSSSPPGPSRTTAQRTDAAPPAPPRVSPRKPEKVSHPPKGKLKQKPAPTPRYSSTCIERGQNLLEQGNIADALSIAQAATQKAPNDPDAWALLGEARLQWGDKEGAIAGYKKAVELRPNDPWMYLDLGSAYQSAGAVGNAIHEFNRAVNIDPHCTTFRSAVGAALLAQGKTEEAITALCRCVEEEPDNTRHQLLLAVAYHDRAYQNWTRGPDQDGETTRHATSREHVEEALRFVQLAEQLDFDGTELDIASTRENVESMLKRTFDGNKVVAGAAFAFGAVALAAGLVTVGVYFFAAGGLYIASCMTPQYLLNRRILASKSGGGSETIMADAAEEGLGTLVFSVFCITILYLPFMIVGNFLKNYTVR